MKSAETIPADVCALVVRVFHDMEDRGERLSLFGLMESAVMADRDTRPAEPAAPVAEAGDGEVALKSLLAAIQLGHAACDADESSSDLSAFREAYGAHNAIEQLLANLHSTLEAERARADAAEQRAADALARAEKAEGALETAQKERKAASEAMRHVGAHFPECAAEFDAIMDRNATRASREAQPATDGGDNG